MEELFGNEIITVRKIQDCTEDYMLFLKWLSDLDVCEYYEGRTKPFSYEMVLEKFEERAKGIDPVIVGIIEFNDKPIGFLQYYMIEPGEYEESDIEDIHEFNKRYGIDIVIGESCFWNKGIGTEIIKLATNFLFVSQLADVIFIAPQTWNKRAIRCYEKCGFRKVKIIKNMELHDDEYKDGLVMIKTMNDKG